MKSYSKAFDTNVVVFFIQMSEVSAKKFSNSHSVIEKKVYLAKS